MTIAVIGDFNFAELYIGIYVLVFVHDNDISWINALAIRMLSSGAIVGSG